MSLYFARGVLKTLWAAALLLQLSSAVHAQTVPTFTIIDPEIALDPGKPGGHGAFLLNGENLAAGNIGKPIEDLAGLDTGLAGGIKFNVRDLSHTENSRRWLLTAEINGLPNNVVQKRYLTFRFDGKTMTLPFTLTNRNPATFVWSVKGPSEISLPPGEPIEISVAVQGVGATNIGLLQSSLLEQSQKRPVEGGWMLCKSRSDNPSTCPKELNLAPHSTQQLLLYPARGSTLVGKYMGNVTIGASEKPEGETLALTVYGTTLARQIAGVVAILAGVSLAWILTVYLQNRLNRNQMLLPVTMLKDRFESLQEILQNRPQGIRDFPCTGTFNELRKSISALSETALQAEGLLPSSIPNPFRPRAPDADAYKLRITEQNARFELLQLVIKSGFGAIGKLVPAAPTAAHRTAVDAALTSTDAISSRAPPPAAHDVVTSLQTILAKLAADLGAGGADQFVAESFKARTSDQLLTEIRTLSGIAWLMSALLTTALGAYVLILSNLGFGTCADFLVCLFWGFGLPAAGTQLAQSTSATASTALGFSMARPSP